LDRLVVKFRAFQKDFSDTPLDQKLIGSFSSFQGKRMKFDYYDKDDRKRYIVKLNNTQYCNDAKVSSFLSDVQANAGINTTSSSVRTIGSGEDVLFQENFANNKVVTDNGVKLTMYNRVNFKVLVSDLDSPALSKNITYTTVADAIREFSCNVQEDLIELYKRAYFSASVNHTNNGLDNIEMMDVGNNEWRLAPSFNNLPSPYSDAEFKVAFDDSLIARNLFDLNEQFQMRLATSVGIDKQVAMALAKQVDDAISSAPELATKHGLSQNDRAFLTGAMPQLSTTSFSASESINKGPRI
jgi:hypothetical protein